MKGKKILDNTKLGMLVIAGLIFLVFTLYMIGRNQNLFGTSITITAVVDNVNGLVPGNNVRFKGMNIGTVRSINMENDTSIFINLAVQKKMKPFIRKNSLTSINTDGLMGNKILQIVPQAGEDPFIVEGDTLFAQIGLDTEEMLRTLESTGDYLEKTFYNLSNVAEKLNYSRALWDLLSDSLLVTELRSAILEIQGAGREANEMARAGKRMVQTFEQGEGLMHEVFTDTLMADNLSQSIQHVLDITEQGKLMMEQVKSILAEIEKSDGTAKLILDDPNLKEAVLNSMLHIEEGTAAFTENMEAMRSNFLFRRYFRRLEKQEERERLQMEKEGIGDGNREEN
ncbi:MCE family protein [Cecembia sp.]|uniref:MlaD family protein n=1 Tax=Cecembia sp. TaxID=1898110 RepID=UPI0025BDF1D5|nr:MCE family protein [Cecembia sp.]